MYDALLLVSFGGPEGPDDVIPFLENVTRGRNIPPERLAEVGGRYAHFGGISPINDQNRALLAALRIDFTANDLDLPIYWGNRNWAPYLADALAEMAADGVRRALAFVTSAYASYSGCRQYRENLAAAAVEVGPDAPQLDKIRHYFNHPGFIEPMVRRTITALGELPAAVRAGAHLVFTTHSIPLAQMETSGPDGGAYVVQHRDTAGLVADAVAVATGTTHPWQLVYQSRSGPPTQPWLGPDVADQLEELHRGGAPAAVLVPIGFVSDHVEVLWDLDVEALNRAAGLGLPVVRAGTVGTDPQFVTMVRELVLERVGRAPQRSLGALGASHDVCPADCCPNPRGSRPAVAQASAG